MKKIDFAGILSITIIILTSIILIGATIIKYDVFNLKDNNNNDNEPLSITLSQIAQKFNSHPTIQAYEDFDTTITATATENAITINVDGELEGIKQNKYTYQLDGNILTMTISNDDMFAALMSIIITEATQQLYGVAKDEASKTLNSEQFANYTVEKEGVELKKGESQAIFKLDISRKITLADFSNTYIKVSDFDNDALEFVKGDGSFSFYKGNIYFKKTGYDEETKILIYEKDNLTNNTYKSLLSAITVIYDEEEADAFAEQYSSLSLGDKTFDRYTIEVNPELNDVDILEDSSYKWIRLTIDKSLD